MNSLCEPRTVQRPCAAIGVTDPEGWERASPVDPAGENNASIRRSGERTPVPVASECFEEAQLAARGSFVETEAVSPCDE